MKATNSERWDRLANIGDGLATFVLIGLLGASLVFLFWASSTAQRIAAGAFTWQGMVDVLLAVAIALLGLALYVRGHPLVDATTWRISYGVATLLSVLPLILLWLLVERIRCPAAPTPPPSPMLY